MALLSLYGMSGRAKIAHLLEANLGKFNKFVFKVQLQLGLWLMKLLLLFPNEESLTGICPLINVTFHDFTTMPLVGQGCYFIFVILRWKLRRQGNTARMFLI